MKKLCPPINLTVFCALPLAILTAVLSTHTANAAVLRTPGVLLPLFLLGATAVFAFVYGVLFRNRPSVPLCVLLPLLGASLLLPLLLAWKIYPLPLPAHTISPELFSLLLGAVPTLFLSILLPNTPADGKRPSDGRLLTFGLLVPLLCAMWLSFTSSLGIRLGSLALSVAVCLYCGAMPFIGRWVASLLPGVCAVLRPRPEDGRARFYERPAVVAVVSIILPLVGLLLNRQTGDFFGEFNSPWFYVVGALNGAVMTVCAMRRRAGLPLLYLQCAGFPYLCYFALVLLPWLILFLPGMILLFAGVLLTVPICLSALSAMQIAHSCRRSVRRHSAAAVALVALLGLATLPAGIGVGVLLERANYHRALDQIESPPAAAEIDRTRLRRTISRANDVYSAQEDALRPGIFAPLSLRGSEPTPLLSGWINAAVVSDRPLTRPAAESLYARYFQSSDVPAPRMSFWDLDIPDFSVRVSVSRTEYDGTNGMYRAWIDLEITNQQARSQQEFSTNIDLTGTCVVGDYSLCIGLENKSGMLVARTAAEAVYEEVVSRSQDPGILSYVDQDTLELRVFPFRAGETRRTSLQLWYRSPVTCLVGGARLTLETPGNLSAARPDGSYETALALLQAAWEQPGDLDNLRAAIAARILTPDTSFIVLETAAQEARLRDLQARILDESAPVENLVRMDEPAWPILLAMLIALLSAGRFGAFDRARRRRSRTL